MQEIFALQHLKDVEEINIIEAEITCETNKILHEINALKNRREKLIYGQN